MILYAKNRCFNIDNNRIVLKTDIEVSTNTTTGTRQFYAVYVDGEYFVDAVGIYLEHKQYLAFEKYLESIDISSIFREYDSMIFCDMGVTDEDGDWQSQIGVKKITFNDYTEKGREGICYFSDIIIDSDKRGEFKKNYIRVDVAL